MTTKKKTTTKPEPFNTSKLHIALRQALDDLRAIEKDDRYTVNMETWHLFHHEKSTCSVCLAGSVMANRLGVPIVSDNVCVMDNPAVEDMLYAMNELRRGWVGDAMSFVHTGDENEALIDLPNMVTVCPYEGDRTEFFADMTKLADMLEEADV